MEEISCEKENILDFDLHLADTQPAVSTTVCTLDRCLCNLCQKPEVKLNCNT